MRTALLVILAIVLGAISTELIAGSSPVKGLVWVFFTVIWYWLLGRGHKRRPAQ